MSGNTCSHSTSPVDAVVLWVDGNDPELTEKRNRYLKLEKKTSAYPGALPTRFASVNEIRYCVLSILNFAPFVRNIFIVTDGQDPNLYEDIQAYFPERMKSIRIVDHKEIFRDYEKYLPSFNSSSIHALIWRINELSDNFVYFNDDFILIREIRPEDWFINNRPVLRGKWLLPPYKIILRNYIKTVTHKYLLKKPDYLPKTSFFLRQWKTASFIGMKTRYFFHCHTPYPLNRRRLEDFFSENKELLEKIISDRFRNQEQLLVTSLAYHLEILDGNRQYAKFNLGYLNPFCARNRLCKRIKRCENDHRIKSVCIQSLDMFSKEEQVKMLGWLERFLNLQPKKVNASL